MVKWKKHDLDTKNLKTNICTLENIAIAGPLGLKRYLSFAALEPCCQAGKPWFEERTKFALRGVDKIVMAISSIFLKYLF